MTERRKNPGEPDDGQIEKERRMGDRRDSHRVPVEVEVKQGDGEYEKHQGNIAIGGVFFEKPLSLPTGAVVHLRFSLPKIGKRIEVRGEVVEISSVGPIKQRGTRVRFSDMDTQIELIIAKFLDHNSGC
jgi:hypothetical protein